MKTKTIEIEGGFYNMHPVSIQVAAEGPLKVSAGQANKVVAHMCGIKESRCGQDLWTVSGADPGEIYAAFFKARYDQIAR